ncbi:MAG: hypothetical protein GW825_02100 [Gallionella sp.]|nr:hypothetical protein [Gallionella sp.]NCS75530.1 hypothetical protein [Gallionella sp.]OIO08869.1 MAG: hypothetical protein AUJ80_05125 [Gallionellaceae bacterium CG1_02_60_325]PIY06465.1 MAG: hypothetical protein COZ19_01135 [Gallionellaceae bacterium CG_4_10_14_3_um_filter_60_1069]PJC04330.1 MAG: hypothetical protein CO069_03910 [Gallionellaceae bacterium CG_4_9_14_0_8_um_filter_60_335]
MNHTDWLGLSGFALASLWPVLHLPYIRRLDTLRRLLFAAAGYVLMMVPLFGLSLAGWLRGIIGDLSLTTLLLLGSALYARLNPAATPLWDARERASLLLFISVMALMLYPFALGWGPLDPYRSGYGSIGLIVMLALLALWALRRGLALLPLAIALAVTGWSFACYESTNLWDYLLDAPLALYALGATAGGLLQQAIRRKRA